MLPSWSYSQRSREDCRTPSSAYSPLLDTWAFLLNPLRQKPSLLQAWGSGLRALGFRVQGLGL